MTQPHYAIMRFAKYKGPEITNIEAHNERRKEKYTSNPDIDQSRSKYNFHLVEPSGKYRTEAERQISAAGCRTRKDSIRVVEVLFTATPEFFKGKNHAEVKVKAFFTETLRFFEKQQAKETILSAVVHMDEKTPHMHLSFVPLTPDGRLSAKDIVGNKKKLIWWQDKFWEHMVQKYPDLERGESASQTGRDHEQIWEITEGIAEVEASGGERFTVKQLERTKKSLEARLEKLQADGRKDDVVTFEQLGVDRLFVDEAYNYKNLFLYTKMRNVAGLSTTDAQKSSDMFGKCRYMDEITGGRGVIFATGTPVSNSMTELYVRP